MGDDLMGSSTSMPRWSEIKHKTQNYSRRTSYLNGNNQIFEHIFECTIQRNDKTEIIEIWKAKFKVVKFEENCNHDGFKIKNIYYLDEAQIVRSLYSIIETIGYIAIERLEVGLFKLLV